MDKQAQQPPKWIDRLLGLYCSAQRVEEIQGDLHELYAQRLQRASKRKADLAYLWDVLKCIRPYAYRMKGPYQHRINQPDMIINYLKLSLRRLLRHKSYSIINITGLALGIVCFVFIYLFVRHELSFDKFHSQKDNIYTVPFTWHFGVTTLPSSHATANIGPLMLTKYAEVEQFLRLKMRTSLVITTDKLTAQEANFIYADSTFFDLLSFGLIEGNPQTALTEPNSVILSEEMANKYFGENWRANGLVGNTISVGQRGEYKVTGVAENSPSNSHIQFDFLGSFSSLREAKADLENFENSAYMTYVLLNAQADPNALIKQVNSGLKERFEGESVVEISLLPLEDIYLHADNSNGVGPTSNIRFVYIFSAIGVLIILIACINYMNLATARSVERAKEVGVKKVMGAYRGQLTLQFLGESFMITLVAVVLAIAAMLLLLPLFNAVAQKELVIDLLRDFDLLGILFMIWSSVSLLAGLYPAFAMSAFSATSVLKGRFIYSNAGVVLRRLLVIFQFAISVVLIVGTLVIHKQLSFVRNADLGYDKDLIISLPLDPQTAERADYLKDQYLRQSDITGASITSQLPSRINFESTFAIKDGEENRQLMRAAGIDNDYINTLGLEKLAGGEMSLTNKDQYEFVINESAATFFNWTPETAIGQKIKIWNSEWGTVTAVVKDFHFTSLHEKIKPLILYNVEEEAFGRNHLMLRVTSEDFPNTISKIGSIWKEQIDHKPFDYTFLNDRLASSYKKEQRLSELFTIFSVLAIVIGCLGLFGLVSYTTFQRYREIGIRKVLGATSFNIVVLLSKSFSRQVMIALAVGIGASYWLMNTWLEGFEYRTTIGWDTIVSVAVITLGIALFTMSFKAIQAALTNPAETLKSD
ncbi:MAG: ABC transporter permease [Bacteroidota bacterium]